MRILFLSDAAYPPDMHAGVEMNTHFLVLHLQARGHTVAVGAVRASATVTVEDDVNGYTVYRGPRLTHLAKEARRRFAPDVMVNQNRSLWPLLLPPTYRRNLGTVFYEHTVMKDAARPPVELRSAALVAANSPMLARFLRRTHGIGALVVPPLFGIDRFRDIAHTPRHVTMISVQRRKGADLAMRLAERRPDIAFTFVESWSENPAETAALLQQLARLPNVTLLANRADLSDVVAGTRLLLMPSRSQEAWGRTATEFQHRGIPVLGSSRGNLAATIGPGGVVLDPDQDFAQWAAAFDRLWDQPEAWQRHADLARDHAARQSAELEAIADRFEFLLQAAQPDRWPRRGRLVEIRRPAMARATASEEDRQRMIRLQAEITAVAESDDRSLWKLAARFAPRPTEATVSAISAMTGLPAKPHAEEIALRASGDREETVLQCLRAYGAAGWHPPIALAGREQLDAALAAGRGAILWVVHSCFASNIVKMALGEAGYALSQISRPEHGLSKTEFGVRCLNRVRTDFEDRYLRQRIRFDRGNPLKAMTAARRVLERNEVLAITAGDWEGTRAVELPFLRGTLRLASGPLRLAALTGATVLPVTGIRHAGALDFEVRIEHPLVLRSGAADARMLIEGCAQFAAYIARVLIRFPSQFRGWGDLGLSAGPAP